MSHGIPGATTTQEEYIKDEMKNLKRELIRAKEEIKRIQSVPLVIGQFNEIIDANYGIVGQFIIHMYVYEVLYTVYFVCVIDTDSCNVTRRNACRFVCSSFQPMCVPSAGGRQ